MINPAKTNCMKLAPPIMIAERIPRWKEDAPLLESMEGTTVLISMKFIVSAKKSAWMRKAVKLCFCVCSLFISNVLLLNIHHQFNGSKVRIILGWEDEVFLNKDMSKERKYGKKAVSKKGYSFWYIYNARCTKIDKCIKNRVNYDISTLIN